MPNPNSPQEKDTCIWLEKESGKWKYLSSIVFFVFKLLIFEELTKHPNIFTLIIGLEKFYKTKVFLLVMNLFFLMT